MADPRSTLAVRPLTAPGHANLAAKHGPTPAVANHSEGKLAIQTDASCLQVDMTAVDDMQRYQKEYLWEWAVGALRSASDLESPKSVRRHSISVLMLPRSDGVMQPES